MASLTVYSVLAGVLIMLAAELAENAAARLRLPRRAVWIAGLAASSVLPFYSIVASRNSSTAPSAVALAEAPRGAETSSGRTAGTDDGGADARTIPVVGKLFIPRVDPPLERALEWPLTILWFGGAVAVALVYGLAWLRLERVALGWSRARVDGLEVLVSGHTGPAVLGFAKPRIVVPRWLLDAPPAMRAMVLRHEREHVAAHDQLLLLAGLWLCALAPWNLVLWRQLHRLRLAIEIDCDARVVRGGVEGSAYARALLAVRERRSVAPLAAVALTEPSSQLERRIRLLFDPPRVGKAMVAVSLAAALTLLVAAGSLEVEAQDARAGEPAAQAPPDARGRVRDEVSELHRQAISGLVLGGKRIAILVDVSATMLDRVPVAAERRRAMSADEQRESPKWRQLVATVDWLTTRIPVDSRFQIIAFNDTARSLVAGTDGWIDGRDDAAIGRAIQALREQVSPSGGRNLQSALAAAGRLSPPADNVYVLVDGLPTTSDTNGGATDRMAHFKAAVESRPPNAPINVILLPLETEALAAPAYWTVALETRGSLVAPSEDWP
jgi:beta-lactamase regulating signal transducer with metallopeptidase domain